MADIRIKDITTTASSTASGDFFVIDGTTGTRKVNAFNPSFGGNATVTGTLTGNGAGSNSFAGGLAVGTNTLSIGKLQVMGGTSPLTHTTTDWVGSSTGSYLFVAAGANTGNTSYQIGVQTGGGSTWGNLILQSGGGTVSVGSTTASTSTSTGALVVSGGVGIAQALFAGESAYFAGAVGASDAVLKNGFGRSANGNSYLDLVGDTTYTDYGLRMIRGSAGANAISEIVHRGTGDFRITTNEAASLVLRTAATAALTLTSAQQVQVNATTASTSTSSGALVVSGGVGVAKEVYAAQFKTDSGTTGAVASGSATTILSLSGKTAQMYLVHASILGVDDAANYAAFATVVMDGTSARIVSNNATLMTITLSGTNVQATQTSGVNQTLVWKYTSL